MRKIIFTLLITTLIFGCDKDESIEPEVLESYIKNLIKPDTISPYEGNYFIQINLTNITTSEYKKLLFDDNNQQLAFYIPGDCGLGMSMQGTELIDTLTKESLEITFYYNNDKDTTFNFRYANYNFADPWNNVAGASISYSRPVSDSDPYTKYYYFGSNSPEYYFEINYIGINRLNGTFKTRLNECCGEYTVYDAVGYFSVPINYFCSNKEHIQLNKQTIPVLY